MNKERKTNEEVLNEILSANNMTKEILNTLSYKELYDKLDRSDFWVAAGEKNSLNEDNAVYLILPEDHPDYEYGVMNPAYEPVTGLYQDPEKVYGKDVLNIWVSNLMA